MRIHQGGNVWVTHRGPCPPGAAGPEGECEGVGTCLPSSMRTHRGEALRLILNMWCFPRETAREDRDNGVSGGEVGGVHGVVESMPRASPIARTELPMIMARLMVMDLPTDRMRPGAFQVGWRGHTNEKCHHEVAHHRDRAVVPIL